jgi:hypothetical protein
MHSFEDMSMIRDLVDKIEKRFTGMTKKQEDLAERIDDKIRETQELSFYHSEYQFLPRSITCK